MSPLHTKILPALLGAACSIVLNTGIAQTTAAPPLRQVTEADLNNAKIQLAKAGCASFEDALHMIESDSEATRKHGSACLN